MPNSGITPPRRNASRAFLAGVRVVVVTVIATVLAFCVALFFGIVGVVMFKMIRGTSTPDMAIAYRHIAFPVALAALVVTFVIALRTEIRHYKRMRTLQNPAAPRTRAA